MLNHLKWCIISLMGNKLQYEIMSFICDWGHHNKTPIFRSAIISKMEKKGFVRYTTINALKVLLRNGFIRKSTISSNKTSYVQLRSVKIKLT